MHFLKTLFPAGAGELVAPERGARASRPAVFSETLKREGISNSAAYPESLADRVMPWAIAGE